MMTEMLETEAYKLPTAVFRDSVKGKVGEIYSYLLSNIEVVFLIVFLIILYFIIRNIRYALMKRKAKKNRPESTNTWFDWKEFEKWQKEQNG